MKILVVGSGGREHAIIRSLSQSKRVEKIYCTPGNGGISALAECFDVKATDIEGMKKLAKQLAVDYVFVAPDDPLAMGMVDELNKDGIKTFGPRANAAIIESSKVFSKALMKKYGIPTADYEIFESYEKAIEYIKAKNSYPIVIKADGLALGKGVIIANDFEEAQQAVNSMLNERKFGDSSKKIVIEEFLSGPEVTVLAFTDGESVVPMVSSMDHKRAYDDDKGLNTGGMGTIAPNPFYTKEVEKEALEKIFIPTINAMNKEGRTFRGCLYFGLMITPQGVKVIEYNARFGDPEAQVVLPMLKTDLVEIMEAIWKKRLKDIDVQWHDGACACVVLASGGYPEKYQTGKEIVGFNSDGQLDDSSSYVYHAGTVKEGNKYLTNGGRVLGVTCRASTLSESVEAAYRACERIKFEKMHFRKDIGKKAL
ncbi:MAG: phosphoribosylamine--glycine ligase [Clostridiales bacterium]|nr:phosphoribosylamine--glycine ligase [Clostridiales bacterium]